MCWFYNRKLLKCLIKVKVRLAERKEKTICQWQFDSHLTRLCGAFHAPCCCVGWFNFRLNFNNLASVVVKCNVCDGW